LREQESGGDRRLRDPISILLNAVPCYWKEAAGNRQFLDVNSIFDAGGTRVAHPPGCP
jgi:hypothetical protein